MSQQERNGGRRELTYSNWHRSDSISRYVTSWQARFLYMSDVDANELCWQCYSAVALIETTRYIGSFSKNADATAKLSAKVGVPSFTVYFIAEEPDSCHACQQWIAPWPDITAFYVVGPHGEDDEPRRMTPANYAAFLVGLRLAHASRCERLAASDRVWRFWKEEAA